MRESARRASSWWGVISDVTELKRSEEDLAQAMATERAARLRLQELDELKDTLLRAVSHDIRTPLSAILGLGVTLARDDMRLDPEDARALAERIVANAKKLDRIVSDVLDLDRLARGKVGIVRAPTDLESLIRGLIDESDVLRSRKVTEQLERVHADVDVSKIERIVDNLLANSVHHSGKDAKVWVRLGVDGEDALLIVEDDGPGVPIQERERVFDAYHRSEDSPGSGVGLSLVKRFAELHGGTAWVENREGGGASFRVRIPLTAPSGTEQTSEPS